MGVPKPRTDQSFDLDETIRRACRRDREAFGQIYREFAPRVHRYLEYRTGTRELAEDLTNQVFVQALKAMAKYQHRSESEFMAWLFRIARNALYDHWRRERNVVRLDPEVHVLEDEGAAEEFERIGRSQELREAMRHLTAEQGEVLAMRFSQDLSHAEIARILGKKEIAVRALQFRALTTLRSLLARESAE